MLSPVSKPLKRIGATHKTRTYYSKSDPLVVIIIKDSTKLRCQLCAVNVRLKLVHCCYELELKANTGIVKRRYSSHITN